MCRTASGKARVVPDVYWNSARSSGAVAGVYRAGAARRRSARSSIATTLTWGNCARQRAASRSTNSMRGRQSSTRNASPSGTKSVKSGTAMAPRFIVPNTAP